VTRRISAVEKIQPEDAEQGQVPGAPPRTGEPLVDSALSALAGLPDRPLAEHAAVFEQVHRRLREVLGELGAGQDT
jgi:hypothetical protein